MLDDDTLLDFDGGRYANYDEGRARELLAGEHGAAYRAQLYAARILDAYRENTAEFDTGEATGDTGEVMAWHNGMGEAIASLRLGHLLPGGAMSHLAP